MSELIPEDLPKGKELVEEGKKIGASLEIATSGYERERKRDFFQWRIDEAKKGSINFFPQMGLSTVDEQVEATKKLYEEFQKRGIDINIMLVTSSTVNGLPPDLREKAPKGTSFILNELEDFKRIIQASPAMPLFGDNMVGTPNSVNNAKNILSAGGLAMGTLSQFTWDYPYWDDDVGQVVETVKALGIIASKYDIGSSIGSYVGDGTSSSFLDHASEVGYCLLEQYVVEELCGARYAISLGGLMSNIPAKMATWLAINDALRKGEVPVIAHIEGNTIEPGEDCAANYGLVLSDFMPYALIERKYKTGAIYTAKPVTEALQVPTLEEIIDVAAACAASLPRVNEIEEAGLFDDTEIIKLKNVLMDNGKKFFKNILKGLADDWGVNVKDPVQVLLAVRRLKGAKLEELYHPGKRDSSRYRGIVPYSMTDLIQMMDPFVEFSSETIRAEKLGDAIKDKKIVVGSADTHEFGLYVLDKVLNAFGAKVLNAGVDLDAEEVLDLASDEGTPFVAMSTHNGQCLDWGKRFVETAKSRNQEAKLFMGGVLNAILEGAAEPVDVKDKLSALGIVPCNDAVDIAKELAK